MGSIRECRIEGYVCRLCSQIDRNVIHIYTDEGLQKKLEQKINVYLKINLTRYDPLPKVICLSCDVKLEQHHRFIQRVIQNQKKIQGERPGLTAERPMIPLLEQHLRVRVSPVLRSDGSGTNTYNIQAISSDSDSDSSDHSASQQPQRSEDALNTSSEGLMDSDSVNSSATTDHDQELPADMNDSADYSSSSNSDLAPSSSDDNSLLEDENSLLPDPNDLVP